MSNQCLMTQTQQPTAPPKKTCKGRPFAKRLMGFEPTTFCTAGSSDAPRIIAKDLEIDRFLSCRWGEACPGVAPKSWGFRH